jgi:hypothetical protein
MKDEVNCFIISESLLILSSSLHIDTSGEEFSSEIHTNILYCFILYMNRRGHLESCEMRERFTFVDLEGAGHSKLFHPE